MISRADWTNEMWMEMALEEANLAAGEDEVPIGAVLTLEGELLAREHNRSIQLNDPSAHAEILAIRKAGEALSNYRLNECVLYVTVEPCAMCAGALVWARIRRVVFGARDEKSGAAVSRVSLLQPALFNHSVEVIEGVLEEHCRQIMQNFFSARR